MVAGLLSPAVTRTLPEQWSGDYTADRARAWIEERDDEGATLLVIERTSRRPIGLMLLFEEPADRSREGDVDVRLGYLFGEDSWGRGYASELVAGLVGWCGDWSVASISGAVADENATSVRVLTKNGFSEVTDNAAVGPGERLYRLDLTG